MPDHRPINQGPNGVVTSAYEIELIDLLRILWKWKYLIFGGTAAFAIAATIISLNMTKIYRIDTVIEPKIQIARIG